MFMCNLDLLGATKIEKFEEQKLVPPCDTIGLRGKEFFGVFYTTSPHALISRVLKFSEPFLIENGTLDDKLAITHVIIPDCY